MKLTENFTLEELTHTNHPISNVPNEIQIENLRFLCEKILQPIRDEFGTINISSGFRSYNLNKYVKGSDTSSHMKGEAADFTCKNMKDVFIYIVKNFTFDQIIWEYGNDSQPSWIHIGIKKAGNRKEVKRIKHGEKAKPFKIK